MLTKVRYSPKDMIRWTRWEVLIFCVYASSIVAAYKIAGFDFLHLPWAPIAVIGTAVAFIVGFQNNAAYGRIWEARKIWGGIVNASRSLAMKVQDMVTAEPVSGSPTNAELEEARRVIVYRHIAWLTALRHAMRQPRPWEEFLRARTNREWRDVVCIPEQRVPLDEDLGPYLSEEEARWTLGKTNKATAILFLQSKHLRALKEKGWVWEFAFLELENVLQELFALQGKSERIKNFPYPRQYATLSFNFVRIFIVLLPFAAIPEFAEIGRGLVSGWPAVGPHFIWVAVPFCAAISWVFYTMERIGRVGENPFEGSANDVPISTISRGIEIDLREMLDEDKDMIPKQFPAPLSVQM